MPSAAPQALVVLICIRIVLVRTGLVEESRLDGEMSEPMTGEELQYLRDDLLWGLAFSENFNMVWRSNDYFADTSKPYAPAPRPARRPHRHLPLVC